MKLQATKELRVFVDRLLYSADVSFTEVGKVPEDKRENLSWKGCYYTIQAGEVFHLLRCNNWDKSFFKLGCGAEFSVDTGDVEKFLTAHSINRIHE